MPLATTSVAEPSAIGENELISDATLPQRSAPSAASAMGTPISITHNKVPNQLAPPSTCRKSAPISNDVNRGVEAACPPSAGVMASATAEIVAIVHPIRIPRTASSNATTTSAAAAI